MSSGKARAFWPLLFLLVFGSARFWTFNAADAGLTIGALLLAVVLWRREAVFDRREFAEARVREQ